MATIDDILKKKKDKPFVPEKRRAWDYLDPSRIEDKIGDISGDKIEENRGHNGVPNRVQQGTDKRTEQGTIGDKIGYIIRDKKEYTTGVTIGDTSGDSLLKEVSLLTGHQRKVMQYVTFQLMEKLNTNYTIDIYLSAIEKGIESSKDTIKKSFQRLQKKGLLIRLKGGEGRNGFARFKLPTSVATECFSMFKTGDRIGDRTGYKIGDSLNSSSSNINKTTTTELPDDWKEIDITTLEHIGFTLEHLRQLLKHNQPQTVQTSINHFAYALEHNEKIKGHASPLNVIMGVLRKGQAWIERNYESHQDKALRQILEQKRAEQARRAAMEKELQDLAFEEWYANLSDAQKSSIVPRGTVRLPEQALKASCREYFINEVYKK